MLDVYPFDDDDDDDDATEISIIGFDSIKALVDFVHWASETFDSAEDLEDHLNSVIDNHIQDITECTRDKETSPQLDSQFWSIIDRSFKNHRRG
jgi:hypothetical protein